MKRLKLALCVGLPLFGMAALPLRTHVLDYPFYHILDFNTVPIFFTLLIGEVMRIHFGYEWPTPYVVAFYLAYIAIHVAFWVPVAYGINRLWERRARHRGQESKDTT